MTLLQLVRPTFAFFTLLQWRTGEFHIGRSFLYPRESLYLNVTSSSLLLGRFLALARKKKMAWREWREWQSVFALLTLGTPFGSHLHMPSQFKELHSNPFLFGTPAILAWSLLHTVSKGRPEADNKVLRNREAAQQFRQRQREHILVLQAEHDRLMAENRAYQEHMSRLRLQKEDLDRDINYARSFLEHTMSIAMANLRHTNRLDQLEPVLAHA